MSWCGGGEISPTPGVHRRARAIHGQTLVKGSRVYVSFAEDYVMIWDHNGWACNDNRNDPCHDYPDMYSGTMGYVVEFGIGE